MNDYADHPPTIGESRSDRSGKAKDWTPRDLLISMLRRVDSGEIKPEQMVICYTQPPQTDEGDKSLWYTMAGPERATGVIGMLESIKSILIHRLVL